MIINCDYNKISLKTGITMFKLNFNFPNVKNVNEDFIHARLQSLSILQTPVLHSICCIRSFIYLLITLGKTLCKLYMSLIWESSMLLWLSTKQHQTIITKNDKSTNVPSSTKPPSTNTDNDDD